MVISFWVFKISLVLFGLLKQKLIYVWWLKHNISSSLFFHSDTLNKKKIFLSLIYCLESSKQNIIGKFDVCWIYCFWVGHNHIPLNKPGKQWQWQCSGLKHLCQCIIPWTLNLLSQSQSVLCVLSFVQLYIKFATVIFYTSWRNVEFLSWYSIQWEEPNCKKHLQTFWVKKFWERKIPHTGGTESLDEYGS